MIRCVIALQETFIQSPIRWTDKFELNSSLQYWKFEFNSNLSVQRIGLWAELPACIGYNLMGERRVSCLTIKMLRKAKNE